MLEQLARRDQLGELLAGDEAVFDAVALPRAGRRVVHDTDTQTCGCDSRTLRTTVPLPTPDGPVSTVSLDTRATYRAGGARPVAGT